MDKVVVVDSNRLFREGLRQLFDGTDFAVTGEAASLDEALAIVARDGSPDLVLLGIDGAGASAYDQVALARQAIAGAKLVVLATRLAPQALAASLEAGADGYLVKDMSVLALAHSLSLVLIGEKVFPTQLAGLLTERREQMDRSLLGAVPQSTGLSAREMDILRCLVHGYSNRAIAEELKITEASVKVHLKAVLRKVQASNRTQAAIWAMNNGFQSGPWTEGEQPPAAMIEDGT
jgi:two-component system nitrate/nitrite response regulator NarL